MFEMDHNYCKSYCGIFINLYYEMAQLISVLQTSSSCDIQFISAMSLPKCFIKVYPSIPPQLWIKDKSKTQPILLNFAVDWHLCLWITGITWSQKYLLPHTHLDQQNQVTLDMATTLLCLHMILIDWLNIFIKILINIVVAPWLLCPISFFILYDIGQNNYAATICWNLKAEAVRILIIRV